jgi:phosphate acetyltransferase
LQAGLEGIRIVEAEDDPVVASRTAVALASAGEVSALMKGSQHTDELLGAVVSRDAHLRTARRMSHVFWFDLPAYHKPLMVTDAVVNMAPSLKDKVDILANAIGFSHAIGLASPKIALLSAIETVNPDHVSSVDAAALSKMADRGQMRGAVIDGPLAFDNAISAASAATKGISSPVAGEPDILMVPSLDVGNVLYKSFIYMGGGECAGLILGARVPIILTSRSDSRRCPHRLLRAGATQSALTQPSKTATARSRSRLGCLATSCTILIAQAIKRRRAGTRTCDRLRASTLIHNADSALTIPANTQYDAIAQPPFGP